MDDEAKQVFADDLPPTTAEEQDEVERLLKLLEHESRGRWPILYVGCVGVIACIAILLGMVAALYVLAATFAGPAALIAALIVAVAAMALICGATRLGTTRRQRDAMLRLAQFNDVRTAPALLTALTWPEAGDHEPVLFAALARLLPQIHASDSAALTQRHRSTLRRLLRERRADLVTAVLTALEQIGDADDIPAVEKLTRLRAQSAERQAIVRAAEECLPALRDRAHRSGNGLLRAAETDSVSLLRAADSRPGIDSATLLRAEEGNSCD